MVDVFDERKMMTTPAESEQSKATYVIEAENAAEMARLSHQARFLVRSMGGVFPEQRDLSSVHKVLDAACGPGGWVLEAAQTYSSMHITGIDISPMMVEYARSQARELGLNNVDFQVMDVMKPLAFPDQSFDLVNARLLLGFMPPLHWPEFIQECRRILRPGGILRLSECEYGITNAEATEKMGALFTQALKVAGQSFSPDGRHIGITPMLGRLLREGGFEQQGKAAFAIDYSAGTEFFLPSYQDLMVFGKLIQPLLVSTGVATQEEIEQTYHRSLEEMQRPDFCGIWYYLTVWGTRPT